MVPNRHLPRPLAEAIVDPVSLRFSDPMQEDAYRVEFLARVIKQSRMALLLGIVFYAGFGFLDEYLIPDARLVAWSIRFGLAVPVGIAVLALSYGPRTPAWIERSFGLVSLAGGLGIAAIVAVAPQPGSYLYYVGFLLVAMFGFTLLGLRFITASILAWVVFAGYLVIAVWANPMPPAVVVSSTFFFISFNIIGMVASYGLESHSRADYLQRRLINEQTARLETTLLEVEARRREAEERARIDPLTSLFNRRHFFSMLDYASAQGWQVPQRLSVLVLDLDHFKQVNDTLGHRAGDQVLQSVAQIIRFSIRPGDIACRYGGEEFAILLPQADLEAALLVGERLRDSLARTEIPTDTGPIRVTVSIGAASLTVEDDPDLESLLDRADAALYAAKRAGRNRVQAARGGEPIQSSGLPVAQPNASRSAVETLVA
ncbi:MAG: diguanylate cyclase [Anaerolineales bacterium]|nr:diguanylate cyclase [Anaerolineales bacterium]